MHWHSPVGLDQQPQRMRTKRVDQLTVVLAESQIMNKKKVKGKHLSSVAFEYSEEEFVLSEEESITKEDNVPFKCHQAIFGDSIVQELSQGDNNAGSSSFAGGSNAAAEPFCLTTTSTNTIDLTCLPSPAFMPHELTPDPTYSDPVEYTHTSGPRPMYKFH
ncbi:hypothetical protein C8R44DRAFT_727105 [Mycena epipterygia]|nr:hypothetical protein C8R44DRAFT_727105 [Mycena epipterygia]